MKIRNAGWDGFCGCGHIADGRTAVPDGWCTFCDEWAWDLWEVGAQPRPIRYWNSSRATWGEWQDRSQACAFPRPRSHALTAQCCLVCGSLRPDSDTGQCRVCGGELALVEVIDANPPPMVLLIGKCSHEAVGDDGACEECRQVMMHFRLRRLRNALVVEYLDPSSPARDRAGAGGTLGSPTPDCPTHGIDADVVAHTSATTSSRVKPPAAATGTGPRLVSRGSGLSAESQLPEASFFPRSSK